ncbi:ABC transporter ATP-binding protein [Vacuolonema iberomarrocanum]|uniref:ABC transporter ATP-binding protein n=1 Tax=Vacuolonema iberomarrocanum TaxID=3454632 RepID=UPI0019D8737E|nr:ATP-binding cassette domain-containing protein [filamentous cyanobacterium LEGE 07170]
MSDPIIRVENLGKKYIIGHQQQKERYTALRDVLANKAKGITQLFNPKSKIQNPNLEEFWALKDVSFEVNRGDRIGIIGRNGAGKSTLLKILSRITEPTTGRIQIKGRVASLLEVGTGFHPELTGRENIYLNGAILGMGKREIHRKFDEIVAFAEVEKFLDTPVKRYSSGMYVRLAFAVAAHLEPEILVVDEVLAVGDASFQKKCLGKMESIAEEGGRTVLFVSHNTQAIQSLCQTVCHLENGQVIQIDKPQKVIPNYFSSISQISSEMTWTEEKAPGNQEISLLSVRVFSDEDHLSTEIFSSQKEIHIELGLLVNHYSDSLCVGFDLTSPEGIVLLRSYQTDLSQEHIPKFKKGYNRFQCTIPKGLLNAGTYCICPRIGIHNLYWIIHLDAVVKFKIILNHGVSPLWNSLKENKNRPGMISPILTWKSTVNVA